MHSSHVREYDSFGCFTIARQRTLRDEAYTPGDNDYGGGALRDTRLCDMLLLRKQLQGLNTYKGMIMAFSHLVRSYDDVEGGEAHQRKDATVECTPTTRIGAVDRVIFFLYDLSVLHLGRTSLRTFAALCANNFKSRKNGS